MSERLTEEQIAALRAAGYEVDGSTTSEDLDEWVHDVKAAEAAEINNGGIAAQFAYLTDTRTKDPSIQAEKALQVMTIPETRCPGCASTEISLEGTQIAEVEDTMLDGEVTYSESTLTGEWLGVVKGRCETCDHRWVSLPTEPLCLDLDTRAAKHVPEEMEELTVEGLHHLLAELRRWADYTGGWEAPVWQEVDEAFNLLESHRLNRCQLVILEEDQVALVAGRDDVARWQRWTKEVQRLAGAAGREMPLAEAAEERDYLEADLAGGLMSLVSRTTLEEAEETEKLPGTIHVEIEGGVIQSIENLPPGWNVEVYDHDNEEIGEEPVSCWS